MKFSYSGHGCDSCGKPDEGYILKDSIWKSINKKYEGFLCLACVKSKLNRPLKFKDFTDAPINFGIFGFDCRKLKK